MSVVRTREQLGPDVVRLAVDAPRVARFWQPGQFVIVRVLAGGERIPLTVVEGDPAAGTVTLVVQVVGLTTRLLAAVPAGGRIADVAGPLGQPGEVRPAARTVVVAGGVGSAVALPRIRGLRAAGLPVTTLLGAASAARLTLRRELAAASTVLQVCTEDGSAGARGVVTDLLEAELTAAAERGVAYDWVLTAGPVPMMAAVADVAAAVGLPATASLNPLMVDGTGMCGGCRVRVEGTSRFACVDGPEFDAHQVDFALLARRNRAYADQERAAAAAPGGGATGPAGALQAAGDADGLPAVPAAVG